MFIRTYSRRYAESLVPAGTLLICVQGGYLAVLGLQDARLIATHCVYDACAANGMLDTTAAHLANNRALILQRNDAVFSIAGTGASVSIM